MKKFKIDKNHCIGAWFISEKNCDNLIKFYNLNIKHTQDGRVAKGVNKSKKDSKDLIVPAEYSHNLINPYRLELQKCLDDYVKEYPIVKDFARFNIVENYGIQHYKKNGGFKVWHCERTGPKRNNRVLVFMTYLNTVKNGGTIFKYQNITIPCIKGLTLIWPTDFTHLHKGQISKTQEKYIITGWYNFI